MLGLFKRTVAAGWYAAAGITFLLAGIPATLINGLFRVTLIVLGILCLWGASYEWWRRRKVTSVRRSVAADRSSRRWNVDFPGGIADIRVMARALERYAIAHDVAITNFGDKRVVLTAQLLIQWANRPLYCVAQPREIELPEWSEVLSAFGFTAKRQLLFPLNVDSHSSVSGHIVFDVRDVGHGVGSEIGESMGGIRDDLEHERDREYQIRFRDELTLDEQLIYPSSIYAPRLDGSGISDHTDLAVAGRASTLNLLPDADPTTR